MCSLSSCLSLTKNLAHASLSSDNNDSPRPPLPPSLQANTTKPPLPSRNNTPTILRKKQQNQLQRKPRQPSVIEIERAIGGGRFRDANPKDLEEQKNAKFDMSMMNFPSKFEGPVEKKLRETGEWVTDKTEKSFRLNEILIATSSIRPRADVAYCIHALSRRLSKTHNWTVALKTLIVIHRTLREGDPTFREELLNFSQRGRILQLSNFKDESSPIAWDCSAWVRTYALFLEERLECFRVLKYDIEAERLPRPAEGQEKGYSRTRELDSEELLEQLPALQQLLYRLIGCRPEGAASINYVIQYALALVLKESFKIYCSINDGIINLVDKFFEMPRHEAVKALDVYKRAGQQAAGLSDFYDVCKGLELARNFQFPVLREPPQSFLITMEEYIKEAPRAVTVPNETLLLTYRPEEPSEDAKLSGDESEPPALDIVPVSNVETEAPLPPPPPPPQSSMATGDLLGLDYSAADVSAIEDRNALALAIITSEADAAPTFNSGAAQANGFDPTGWELALVSTPSTDISAPNERQLAGGLDSLTLNSLYDEGAYRASQKPVYGAPAPNPFEVQDPFAFSNNVAPPPAVQITSMAQQQSNPFGPFQPTYHQPQPNVMMGATNPFGDTTGFGTFPASAAPHPQSSNPFGSTGLL